MIDRIVGENSDMETGIKKYKEALNLVPNSKYK